VVRDRANRTIYLDQQQYLRSILDKFGFHEPPHSSKCHPSATVAYIKFSLKSRNASFSRFEFLNLQCNLLHSMAQRAPLAPISRNQQRGPDLSPYIRGKIATLKECGVTTSAISRRLSLPRSTIQSTLDLDEIRKNGESQPRIGRALSYTPSNERRTVGFYGQSAHTRNSPTTSLLASWASKSTRIL
jgi:hypothetical protein